MTPPDPPQRPDPATPPRRSADDALLAELRAPPPLEDARESYEFWRRRLHTLPVHKRAERNEAEQMLAQAKQRLAAAERERYGPGPLEQLLTALGIRRQPTLPSLPSRRTVVFGLGLFAILVTLALIALLVAIVVFWPELQPIVRTLLRSDGGGDG